MNEKAKSESGYSAQARKLASLDVLLPKTNYYSAWIGWKKDWWK